MTTGPTIYDIAEKAGVGIATVSRVLNGSGRVAETTRLAVQSVVAELGFRPNRAAQRLALRGANRPRVSILMPFFSAAFYVGVSRSLCIGLAEEGIDPILHDVENRENKNRVLDRLAEERSCEAIVLCSMGIGPERLAQLVRLGLPLVSVDYPMEGIASITVDNRSGITQAVALVGSCGARQPAFLGGPSSALAFREREAAFRACLPGAPVAVAAQLNRESGADACRTLRLAHPGIDALVCANDILAIGALEVLRQDGVQVPGEVQIVGFDDQPLMDVIGLSTVRQPLELLGGWAAAAILSKLTSPTTAVESLILDPVIIPRATTRAVAALPPPARVQ